MANSCIKLPPCISREFRAPKVVALQQVGSESTSDLKLPGIFDTSDGDLRPAAVKLVHQAGDHSRQTGCVFRCTNQRAVQLDDVRLQLEHSFQTGMRCSEIVHGDLVAQATVITHRLLQTCSVFHRRLLDLSLIHISEPTRLGMISYAVFCLKKK